MQDPKWIHYFLFNVDFIQVEIVAIRRANQGTNSTIKKRIPICGFENQCTTFVFSIHILGIGYGMKMASHVISTLKVLGRILFLIRVYVLLLHFQELNSYDNYYYHHYFYYHDYN